MIRVHFYSSMHFQAPCERKRVAFGLIFVAQYTLFFIKCKRKLTAKKKNFTFDP